jgi:hypothetical protein
MCKSRTGWRTIDLVPIESRLQLLHCVLSTLLKLYPVGTLSKTQYECAIVPCAEGFPIVVSKTDRGRLIIRFGSWYDDALSASDMIILVNKALSGNLRVIDERIGGKPYRQTIELLTSTGEWRSIGGNSFIRFFSRWRSRTIIARRFPHSYVNATVTATGG